MYVLYSRIAYRFIDENGCFTNKLQEAKAFKTLKEAKGFESDSGYDILKVEDILLGHILN